MKFRGILITSIILVGVVACSPRRQPILVTPPEVDFPSRPEKQHPVLELPEGEQAVLKGVDSDGKPEAVTIQPGDQLVLAQPVKTTGVPGEVEVVLAKPIEGTNITEGILEVGTQPAKNPTRVKSILEPEKDDDEEITQVSGQNPVNTTRVRVRIVKDAPEKVQLISTNTTVNVRIVDDSTQQQKTVPTTVMKRVTPTPTPTPKPSPKPATVTQAPTVVPTPQESAARKVVGTVGKFTKTVGTAIKDTFLSFGGWKKTWSEEVAEKMMEVNPEWTSNKFLTDYPQVSKDIRKLCPKYTTLDDAGRMRAWTLFFASIAKAESSFDEKLDYDEPGVSWNSKGLFQLTPGNDAGHGGDCKNLDKGGVFNPETNIRCAVRIMNHQIKKRKTLFPKGDFYYWSTLTRPAKVKKVVTYYNANAGSVGCR